MKEYRVLNFNKITGYLIIWLSQSNKKNRTIKRLAELEEKKKTASELSLSSINSLIGQLERELEEYNALKRGEFELPKNITFAELMKNITKIRIAKGLSQQDLANLLGTTKQQINRYEEHDYQNVSLVKISEIIAILGLSVSLEKLEDTA